MSNRVLIIGLDGADWRILQPYLVNGLMPNLTNLIEKGVSGPLRSTIPTNSYTAWSTFMTGRNPGKHGIYDFSQRSPHDSTLMVGINSQTLQCETFFEVLGRHNRQVGAINVPVTFPPFPVNGFMLGGMFVQEGKPFTFPESLATELDEQVGGFPVNCINWADMVGQLEKLLDEAISVTRQRGRVLEYLIDHKDWDVLVQVFLSPDRLQHAMMHIFDPDHPYYDSDLAQYLSPKLHIFFQVIDNIIGRSLEQIDDEDTLMIISDHGFRGIYKAIHMREILAKYGLLKVTRSSPTMRQSARKLLRSLPKAKAAKQALARMLPIKKGPAGWPDDMANLDWSQTQAYVTAHTSQGIYINLVGREPQGIVEPGVAYERLLDKIEEILLAERDPDNGQPLIESVIRTKEYFSGPRLNTAPDLLFVPASGYTQLRAAKTHLGLSQWHVGDHDLDGIFVASGPGLKRGAKISKAGLIDVAPTTLYLANVPIPEDMDGQVLDVFANQQLENTPPKYEQGTVTYQDSDYVYTAEEERQVEEQLRSLGYL